MRSVYRMGIAGLCALSLAGCGSLTRTTYERPHLEVPGAWATGWATANSAVGPQESWWSAFKDSALDSLVGQVLAANHDIARSGTSVERARQAVALSRAAALPVLGLSASANTSQRWRGTPYRSRSGTVGATASYGVDLWGTTASTISASEWELKATQEDRDAVVTQVIATTIDLYYQLAFLSQQRGQSELSLKNAGDLLAIANASYKAGMLSAVDRLSAEQSTALQRSNLAAVVVAQSQAEHALSLLLGEPPEKPLPPVLFSHLEGELPTVSAGIPADVLRRRPDVKAAELRLRESLDLADSANLRFWPTLTLTGSVGSSSQALLNVLQNPIGTAAAVVTAPLINWWTREATVGAARASVEETKESFVQTFYGALADVEDALSSREQLRVREIEARTILDTSTAIAARYEFGWRTGMVSMQSLLVAQENERVAQTSLAAARYAQRVNLVALYVALGAGGVEPGSNP